MSVSWLYLTHLYGTKGCTPLRLCTLRFIWLLYTSDEQYSASLEASSAEAGDGGFTLHITSTAPTAYRYTAVVITDSDTVRE